jgi:hypothetical protein
MVLIARHGHGIKLPTRRSTATSTPLRHRHTEDGSLRLYQIYEDTPPFIPEFTIAPTKSPKVSPAKMSLASSWSDPSHLLASSASKPENVGLSQERLQALAKVELFRDRVNIIVEGFSRLLKNTFVTRWTVSGRRLNFFFRYFRRF